MKDGRKIDPTDGQAVLDEFEWIGIIRRTGEWRKGQPVYALTEFGLRIGEDYPGEKEFNAAVEALILHKLAHSSIDPEDRKHERKIVLQQGASAKPN